MKLYFFRIAFACLLFFLFVDLSLCQEIDIVYTNNTFGFLQPCSCPGAPYGGLNRRGTILKIIKQDKKDLILLDAGDLLSNNSSEKEKNLAILDIYKFMNYDAVNAGRNEISQGIEFLKEKSKSIPFISSNVVSDKDKISILNSHFIIEKNGVKVGILGIMANDPNYMSEFTGDSSVPNVNVLPPVEVLKREIKALQGNCDFIVVLSRLTLEENRLLAEDIEGIDLIIGGFDFVPNEEAVKVKNTILVQSGTKGHYVGKITLSKKEGYHPVNKLYTLNNTIPNDPEIQKMIDDFENKLADRQLKSLQENSRYLGSANCRGCHEKEYSQWETTKHTRALEGLKKGGKDRVIGCLSCHTLGYNVDGEVGIQCEHCHKMLTDHDRVHREPVGVSRSVCIKCHTAEQSPKFDYIEYLKQIIH